jgi:hypothetical protein
VAGVEKKFFEKVEKFSKYFPSALEDHSFTIYREGHGTSEMAKIF